MLKHGEYNSQTCYTFNFYGTQYYIDKETLLPISRESEKSSEKIEYNIEYDEKILQEPDFEQFDMAYYHDSFRFNNNGTVFYDKFREEPLEGTNDSTQPLIENVVLNENENLDVLPIKEDSFGLKSVEVDSLDLYNILKKKYTNLRTLTPYDFNYYSVIIAYKKGYELTYVNTVESIGGSGRHYVFSEKETEKDNIVLIVEPRALKGGRSIVISNEKLTIPANQIQEIYFADSNEIEENIGLDKDLLYCNSATIVKLKKENYEKLDYVKTKLDENSEPICWEIEADINVRNERYGEVYTYINAITGEVIGARYIRNNN